MTPTIENRIAQNNLTTAKPSFAGSLFGFEKFVTPVLVKIIYIAGLVLIPLAMIGSSLAMFLFALVKGAGAAFILPGIIQVIVSIIASLLAILILRVYCECVAVVFKIKEDVEILKDRNRMV